MFSHSLHLSCTFSIRPYSPMGLPSELPLCLQKKKMTFPLPIPKSKLHHSNCVPNKCTAQLLLNVFFSHSLHLSCTLSIHAYSPMGFPSELPLCLQKKPLSPPKSKLHHSGPLPNKCTAQLLQLYLHILH